MAFTMTVAEVIAADTTGLLGKHSSWERVPLAQIAEILNGAPFDSALFSNSEGMPLARIRDVIAGDTSTYYTGQYEETYIIRHGDLLVGMDGDFNSGFWGVRPALLNQRVCKITPIEQHYEKRLLSLALPGYLAAINANTPSVTVKHLSSKTIGEIELPLPPRAEQTRIVAKLEELLSDLDAGVAELKAAQKKLAQYRQSLLKAAVEGALTAQWREEQRTNNTPAETGAELLARILTERRARWEAKQLAKFADQGKTPPKDWQKKYPEPVPPDTSDLPQLPQGWVWVTTGLIAESIVPNRDKPLTFTGHIPWITTPDFEQAELHLQKSISGLGLSESECEMYRARVVPSQAVIMTCVGRFGLSAVLSVRAVINQQLHAFIPGFGIRAEYLAFVIQAQRNWLERHATSTTIAYLNKEKCESLPVPLPPINEQDAILNLLKTQLCSIAEQLRNIDLSLKQSTAQRQNLLHAAFAGELVPQDPSDEPASVLLERIRAERAAQAAVKKPRGRKAKESA